MNIIKARNLACPIDGKQLEFQEKHLACENAHVFDISRLGYVNLLPVQHKRTKQPGDSKEMVAARKHFLNTGTYEPIAHKLAEITFEQITGSKDSCIMDAGCGEGYYFNYLHDFLKQKENDNNLSFVGLDISKPAITEASKRNKQTSWVVGTNRQPPVHDESIDIILCMFGFQSFEGFNKALKPGGKIILVEPGPDHLKELRKIIYTEVKKSDLSDLSHVEKIGLSLIINQSLQFKTGPINNEQINNLLLMTPHFYRATKERREAVINLKQLDLTVDVVFRVLKKC